MELTYHSDRGVTQLRDHGSGELRVLEGKSVVGVEQGSELGGVTSMWGWERIPGIMMLELGLESGVKIEQVEVSWGKTLHREEASE